MKKLLLSISMLVTATSVFLNAVEGPVVAPEQPPLVIITHVYNRPDFIELHKKTFDAFLKEDYRYVVFNDAADMNMSRIIQETCAKLNIECLRVPDHAPHRQSPGHRHMDGIKFSLDEVGFKHDGIVMIIDSDMFLVRPLSLYEYMADHHLVGGYQERHNDHLSIVYTSPCLVMINMGTAPNKETINFDGNYVEGVACDVGGHSYYYFRDNPTLRYRLYTAVSKDFLPMDAQALTTMGYDFNSIDLLLNLKREYGFEFHGDTNFIHFYAGGSNWPGYSPTFINAKTIILNDFVDKQIAYYANKK